MKADSDPIIHIESTDRMIIAIIRDSRNQVSYGARTVVPTLSQMIATITKEHFFIELPPILYLSKIYNKSIVKYLLKHPETIFSRVLVKLDLLFGAIYNLVESGINPHHIAKLIIKHRSKNDDFNSLCTKIESADLMVLDGDGDFVLSKNRIAVIYNLIIMELCKALNRRVILLNSIISEPSLEQSDDLLKKYMISTFRKCKEIYLRDRLSVNTLHEYDSSINVKYIPDVLFLRFPEFDKDAIVANLPAKGNYILPHRELDDRYFDNLDFSRDYICLTGGAGAAKCYKAAVKSYCTLVEKLNELQLPIYLIPTCNGDRFLYEVSKITGTPLIPSTIPAFAGGLILANAKLFISGRYHPAILASFGGTPTIFLEADCHKMRSLQQLIGYTEEIVFSSTPFEDQCEQIYELSLHYLQNQKTMGKKITAAVKARYSEALQYYSIFDGDSRYSNSKEYAKFQDN